MNLAVITPALLVIPYPVGTGSGGAALSSGLMSLEGAGTGTTGRDGPGNTAAESEPNRVTDELAPWRFQMRNNQFQFRNRNNSVPETEPGKNLTAVPGSVVTPESIVVEMQTAMRVLAEPAVPGEPANAAIRRASREAGLTFSQARKLYYGVYVSVKAHIVDQVRLRVEAKAQRAAARSKSELLSLEARLERIERALGVETTS